MFRDSRPSFAPKTQLSALARYRFPKPVVGGQVSAQVSGNYASPFYDNIRNFAGFAACRRTCSPTCGSAGRATTRAGRRTLFVNNVADRQLLHDRLRPLERHRLELAGARAAALVRRERALQLQMTEEEAIMYIRNTWYIAAEPHEAQRQDRWRARSWGSRSCCFARNPARRSRSRTVARTASRRCPWAA